MTIPKKGITATRKTPEKLQFLIDNYSKYTRRLLAEKLGESPRWVKRQLSFLFKEEKLVPKVVPPENPLIESDWTDSIKCRAFELRKKYLKTNPQICQILKKEFDFSVNPPAFQFWMKRFGYSGSTKQEWMGEFLTKAVMDEFLDKSYRMVDISNYIKKIYGVYISDDLILIHVQKLGLLSYKLKRLFDINEKAQGFSKEWLSQKIQEHAGLKGLSEEMGVSKTIVMKRLKDEGLSLIKHRKIWSENLEIIRNQLLDLSPIENIPPEDFHQMILGWLVGDGHIDFNGRFVTTHSIRQLDYMYLKIRVLKRYITNIITDTGSSSEVIGILGGKNQIGISCPGLTLYIKYLNKDGSKNHEKIFSELNELGWACYFMDDGSFFYGTKVMSIDRKIYAKYINRYIFGPELKEGLLEVNEINSKYVIPGFSYKCGALVTENYWRRYAPELFDPKIRNDLALCLVKKALVVENSKILEKTLKYYKKRGFPYFSVSDNYLNKEYKNLQKINPDFFWKDNKIFRFVKTGYQIIKHFMPHIIDVSHNGVSIAENFNDYSFLYSTLESCLRKEKSILPDFVYDHLLNTDNFVSVFPCSLSKGLVQKFSKEGATVVDPCIGWGGRLLGTRVSRRRYVGFEPWVNTYKGLTNIINYFKIENVKIINAVFDPLRAPDECQLILTSPPYLNLEKYGETVSVLNWQKLMQDIFTYAENSLTFDGYLILNIPRLFKKLIPSTSLKEINSLYFFTSTRKKDINKAEILYIWSK